jgi:hypothetical protein
MNYGLRRIDEEILTKSRRPPQVKSSKAQIQAKYHKIPTIRFEDQTILPFIFGHFSVTLADTFAGLY